MTPAQGKLQNSIEIRWPLGNRKQTNKTPKPNAEQSVIAFASCIDTTADTGMSGGSQTVDVWIVSNNRVRSRAYNKLGMY